jgi:hypothetical protein
MSSINEMKRAVPKTKKKDSFPNTESPIYDKRANTTNMAYRHLI